VRLQPSPPDPPGAEGGTTSGGAATDVVAPVDAGAVVRNQSAGPGSGEAEKGEDGLSIFEPTAGAYQPGAGQFPQSDGRGGTGMSKQEELARIIYDMRRSIPELHGVMIASTDGLSIAHDFPEAEAEKIAAMAATALGLGKRITERTNLGELHEAVVRGDYGYLVVYSAGEKAILVMSGPITSNLGLMRIEARTASALVGQVLR
jgi:predicted regulator of Ras-like GTPase activity (Roadblock/LC7/MglB family)